MSAARIKSAWSMPDELWTSPAYRKLSAGERVLVGELLALAKRFGTDEPIICSAETAAQMLNVDRMTAWRTMSGLRNKGFIVLMKPGDRTSLERGRKAAEWRLTFLPYQGKTPTHEYRRIHDKALGHGVDPHESFITAEMEGRLYHRRPGPAYDVPEAEPLPVFLPNVPAEERGERHAEIVSGAAASGLLSVTPMILNSQAIEIIEGGSDRFNITHDTKSAPFCITHDTKSDALPPCLAVLKWSPPRLDLPCVVWPVDVPFPINGHSVDMPGSPRVIIRGEAVH
jgi:hypothetical protein